MIEATLSIEGPAAETAVSSISPEAGRELPRTTAEMELVDGKAVLHLTAADPSSMRAAINSYLECMQIIEDIGHLTTVRK